jgi:glycosyltransferase involved in cell wall biosynthesis
MCDGTKILHLTERVIGGHGTILEQVAPAQNRYFGRNGIRFAIPADEVHLLAGIDTDQIVTFPQEPRTPGGFARYVKHVARIIRRERPHLIHMHGTIAGAAARLLMFGRRRIKLVHCSHGWAFTRDDPAFVRRLYRWAEVVLAYAADAIVCPSPADHGQALRAGLPPGRLRLIVNGVSLPAADPTVCVPLDPNDLNLLFVGRFEQQKGLDLLIEAMRKIQAYRPDIKLHLAGAGPDSASLDLPENVTLLGWRSRQELSGWYRAADAVVMPSRWEAFGLVAVEAMSQGTPAIVSDRGALPYVVDYGRAGIIFGLEPPDALADTLLSLDRAMLRALGDAAAKRYRSTFTTATMNDSLIELYEELLDGTIPRNRTAALPVAPGPAGHRSDGGA